jgi:hypothetical protein
MKSKDNQDKKSKFRKIDLKDQHVSSTSKPTYTTLENILTGYANLVVGNKKELKNKRLTICKTCPYLNIHLNSCSVCGCFLPAKASDPASTCPKNKWEN